MGKKLESRMYVDETPWPGLAAKEWLWVRIHSARLFRAADTRSRVELEQILGSEYQSYQAMILARKIRLRSTTGIMQPRNRNVWHTYDDIFCD